MSRKDNSGKDLTDKESNVNENQGNNTNETKPSNENIKKEVKLDLPQNISPDEIPVFKSNPMLGPGPHFMASIDQGTSSTRFMVFDIKGTVIASHQVSIPQIYPQPGWVEQDPMAILDSCHVCMEEAVKQMNELGLDPAAIKSIGISNQRETTVVWYCFMF